MDESKAQGSATNKKKPIRKTIPVTILVVVILISAILAVLTWRNIIYFGLTLDKTVVVYDNICNDDDIATYNSFMETDSLNAVFNANRDTEGIAKLESDIKSRPNVDKDATCQYMLWRISHMSAATDSQAATDNQIYLDNLIKLNEADIYPSNKLYDLRSIKAQQELMAELNGETDE